MAYATVCFGSLYCVPLDDYCVVHASSYNVALVCIVCVCVFHCTVLNFCLSQVTQSCVFLFYVILWCALQERDVVCWSGCKRCKCGFIDLRSGFDKRTGTGRGLREHKIWRFRNPCMQLIGLALPFRRSAGSQTAISWMTSVISSIVSSAQNLFLTYVVRSIEERAPLAIVVPIL